MAVKQKTKTFHQADFATELHVPEGTPYVEARSYDAIMEALESGTAVYVESSEGRAFFWKDGNNVQGDLFFMSQAKMLHFDSVEAAADAAMELVELPADD